MDQRDRVVLESLLEDYNKLDNNKFFHGFLAYLRKMAQYCLEQCGKESYLEQKIRYYQGAHEWLRLAGSEEAGGLVNSYLRTIKDAVEKIE